MAKNIYLYGASDDCCECETDFIGNYESYSKIKINHIIAEYKFDGDWGVKLTGDIPESWKVHAIAGKCCRAYRDVKNAGQFIHIQVPDNEGIEITEINNEEE